MNLLSPVQAYALTAGGILVTVLIARLSTIIYRFLLYRTTFFLLRHFVYPLVWRRHGLVGPMTRYQLFVQLCYLTGTFVCNSIGVSSLAQAGLRAGSLSAIHFIPLFFGGHLSFVADIIGVSLQSYRSIHGSVGFMAFALALFHVVVAVSVGPRVAVNNQFYLYGIVVGTPTVRQIFY